MATESKKLVIASYVFTVLSAAVFVMSAAMKFSGKPEVIQNFASLGFSQNLIAPIGVIEVLCLVLYLIPRTSILGAVLVTGYLGGALCTHLRAGQSVLAPLVIGVFVWAGVYLRTPTLRALLPFKKS